VRAAVHLVAAVALAALAFAIGRWLRDPAPGGPFVILLGATILWVAAVHRLYRRGGRRRPLPHGRRPRPGGRVRAEPGA
jgi:hypothetical protein